MKVSFQPMSAQQEQDEIMETAYFASLLFGKSEELLSSKAPQIQATIIAQIDQSSSQDCSDASSVTMPQEK